MVILKYKKSGKVLKLWHVNANSVDIMRLNILSWGLLDPIGTSRIKPISLFCTHAFHFLSVNLFLLEYFYIVFLSIFVHSWPSLHN